MTLNRRQWMLLGGALLLLGLLKLSLIGWYLQHRDASPAVLPLACPSMTGRCSLPDGASLLFVEPPIEGRAFTLALEGDFEREPAAEFSMRSMDMGFNRYRFIRANGRWEARVTLPACVSGRHDWLMTLDLPGQKVQIPLRVQ
jgi:hypothetical protein